MQSSVTDVEEVGLKTMSTANSLLILSNCHRHTKLQATLHRSIFHLSVGLFVCVCVSMCINQFDHILFNCAENDQLKYQLMLTLTKYFENNTIYDLHGTNGSTNDSVCCSNNTVRITLLPYQVGV